MEAVVTCTNPKVSDANPVVAGRKLPDWRPPCLIGQFRDEDPVRGCSLDFDLRALQPSPSKLYDDIEGGSCFDASPKQGVREQASKRPGQRPLPGRSLLPESVLKHRFGALLCASVEIVALFGADEAVATERRGYHTLNLRRATRLVVHPSCLIQRTLPPPAHYRAPRPRLVSTPPALPSDFPRSPVGVSKLPHPGGALPAPTPAII